MLEVIESINCAFLAVPLSLKLIAVLFVKPLKPAVPQNFSYCSVVEDILDQIKVPLKFVAFCEDTVAFTALAKKTTTTNATSPTTSLFFISSKRCCEHNHPYSNQG